MASVEVEKLLHQASATGADDGRHETGLRPASSEQRAAPATLRAQRLHEDAPQVAVDQVGIHAATLLIIVINNKRATGATRCETVPWGLVKI